MSTLTWRAPKEKVSAFVLSRDIRLLARGSLLCCCLCVGPGATASRGAPVARQTRGVCVPLRLSHSIWLFIRRTVRQGGPEGREREPVAAAAALLRLPFMCALPAARRVVLAHSWCCSLFTPCRRAGWRAGAAAGCAPAVQRAGPLARGRAHPSRLDLARAARIGQGGPTWPASLSGPSPCCGRWASSATWKWP